MNLGRILRFGIGAVTVVFLWAVAASPVLAAEGKPNVVWARTAAASCAGRRRLASTGLPARDFD